MRIRLAFRRLLRSVDHVIETHAQLSLRMRVIMMATSVPVTIVMFVWANQWNFIATVIAYSLLLLGIAHERATHSGSAARFRETLILFGERVDAHHTYGEYKLVYEVDSRELDPWFRQFSIRPIADSIIVHVKRFFVGATQAIGRRMWTFDDLAIHAETDRGEVYVVETGYKPETGGWSGDLLLECPITSADPELRSIILRGRWPGLWNRLRDTERDSGAFRLDVEADVLEISVIFPRSWASRTLAIAPSEFPSDVGESKKPERITTKSGKPQLIWRILGATAGTYRYEVVATISRSGSSR